MGTIKSFFAFVLGLIALLFCYNNVHLPVVVSFCYYIPGMLFINKHYAPRARIFFIALLTLIGFFLYGFNIVWSIKYFPQYRSVFGIIIDFTNVIFVLSSGWFNAIGHIDELLRRKEQNN